MLNETAIAAGCRRLLRLSNVIDDRGRPARCYRRTCCVSRRPTRPIVGQPVEYLRWRSNHRRRRAWKTCARHAAIARLLARGRRTVVIPCITGVTGHQIATTVTRVAVVRCGQADDLALNKPFTRHGTNGRRRAHDGWNSRCADHSAATAAHVGVARWASAAIESGGIIPESL